MREQSNNMRYTCVARWTLVSLAFAFCLVACSGKDAATSQAVSAAPVEEVKAPRPETTGGFDGQRAYQHVVDLVAIGPHSAGTDGDRRAQDYIIAQLKSFGCPVDQEDFHTPTPIGNVAMKNIVAKIPGSSPDILMFTTHYDSKLLPNFVGADDGGSSTGVMLEFAHLVCARKNAMTVWVVFFDGEEAFGSWSDSDSVYGSRELAARMALSGDLPRVKAMVLADLVGSHDLRLKRETNSTGWLTDLVWSTAAKLGYGSVFVSDQNPIDDDHGPFLKRQVPAVDIVRCCDNEIPYWHTAQDTLDKVSPQSLAIVGHVLIATLPELEQKFHPGQR